MGINFKIFYELIFYILLYFQFTAGTESGTANSKSVLSAHSSGGGNDGPTPTTRNLFYTSPSAWWGDIAEDNNNEVTGKKMEHDCSASPRSRPSIGSVKESLQQPEQSVSSPVKVTQKAIRMDIDLNQPMVVEATQSKGKSLYFLTLKSNKNMSCLFFSFLWNELYF